MSTIQPSGVGAAIIYADEILQALQATVPPDEFLDILRRVIAAIDEAAGLLSERLDVVNRPATFWDGRVACAFKPRTVGQPIPDVLREHDPECSWALVRP